MRYNYGMNTFTLCFASDFALAAPKSFPTLALAAAALVTARAEWPLSGSHIVDADGLVVGREALVEALVAGLDAPERFRANLAA